MNKINYSTRRNVLATLARIGPSSVNELVAALEWDGPCQELLDVSRVRRISGHVSNLRSQNAVESVGELTTRGKPQTWAITAKGKKLLESPEPEWVAQRRRHGNSGAAETQYGGKVALRAFLDREQNRLLRRKCSLEFAQQYVEELKESIRLALQISGPNSNSDRL